MREREGEREREREREREIESERDREIKNNKMKIENLWRTLLALQNCHIVSKK